MSTLVVATHNPGKIKEIRDLLARPPIHLERAAASSPLRVLSLSDVGITQEVEETANTFRENAILKAVGYDRLVRLRPTNSDLRSSPPSRPGADPVPIHRIPDTMISGQGLLEGLQHKDLLTLADDSGLEVTALGGAPGVKSARYGGPGLSDEERCDLLLREMAGIPEAQRTARFVCVLALARKGALIQCFEGRVEGRIAFEPRGKNGFGYDPVFLYPPFGRTFGEAAPSEKDEVSHRGQALRKLQKFLQENELDLGRSDVDRRPEEP